jgi:small multidrug resistance family-3 protein
MLKAAFIFFLAGLAEIGGGYLIWQWLREDASRWYGLVGGIALVLYGVIATWQTFPTFSRVYAAYGGVFIVMSLFWGMIVDKKMPDMYDWVGGAICLVGVTVMLWSRG